MAAQLVTFLLWEIRVWLLPPLISHRKVFRLPEILFRIRRMRALFARGSGVSQTAAADHGSRAELTADAIDRNV
jgi:hypothetical protein